jgi:mannose-6-phosphate isomerase-like protein (cupin superfamily)
MNDWHCDGSWRKIVAKKETSMKNTICIALIAVCLFGATPTQAQTPAIVIKDADMQAKLKEMIDQRIQDSAVRIVNAGEGNLGVFLIHLNPGQTPPPPVQLMSHNDVSEVYYVIKGEGMLYHGGTIQNATPRNLTTTGGPSMGGPGSGNLTVTVGPGDVFIVPAKTPHQVNLGAKTEMIYLLVRVDPKKHLELK